jgi:methylenetetrahydrofolate reductase (NADPH)
MIDERGGKPFVSLEFFPPKDPEQWPGFFETVERLKDTDPLFVSVTYGAGGGTQANTLEIVKRMQRDRGLETMSHLTCVQASEDKILDFLSEIEKVGASNVLALRGDPPKGGCAFEPDNERFRHASDLAAFIKEHHPEMGVGVAAYPEPHPESDSVREDLHWTKVKLDIGDFATTQLFFDNRVYFDFVQRLSAMGMSKPVIPGVLPIPSLQSAKFILGLCGANIPGGLLLDLENADKEGGPEAARKVGIEYAREQIKGLIEGGAPGVHLYTLNKAEHCMEALQGLGL